MAKYFWRKITGAAFICGIWLVSVIAALTITKNPVKSIRLAAQLLNARLRWPDNWEDHWEVVMESGILLSLHVERSPNLVIKDQRPRTPSWIERLITIVLATVPEVHRDEMIGDFKDAIALVKSRGGGKWSIRAACVFKCVLYLRAAYNIRISELTAGKSKGSGAGDSRPPLN